MERLYFFFNPTESDPEMWVQNLALLAIITLSMIWVITLIPFFLRHKRNKEVRVQRTFFGITLTTVVITQIVFCLFKITDLNKEGGVIRWFEIIGSALLFSIVLIFILYFIYTLLDFIPRFKLRKNYILNAIFFRNFNK